MQTAGKPRGLQAARKLRVSRRDNRWADKSYKKRALGNIYKTSPTGGSSHAKGIVLEKVSVHYGIRGCWGLSASKMGRERQEERRNSGRLWETGTSNGDERTVVHWLGTVKLVRKTMNGLAYTGSERMPQDRPRPHASIRQCDGFTSHRRYAGHPI
jgi:hypothetical protein